MVAGRGLLLLQQCPSRNTRVPRALGFRPGSGAEWFVGVARRIARGAEFQTRFAAVGGDAARLFGLESGYEIGDAQLSLVQWARWYKSLYEMSSADRPDDDLLEDDAALDRWFDAYLREQARKAARSYRGSVQRDMPVIELAGGLQS